MRFKSAAGGGEDNIVVVASLVFLERHARGDGRVAQPSLGVGRHR